MLALLNRALFRANEETIAHFGAALPAVFICDFGKKLLAYFYVLLISQLFLLIIFQVVCGKIVNKISLEYKTYIAVK